MSTVDEPWVLSRVEHLLVAIPAENVVEMVRMPAITQLPATPAHIRGLVQLREGMLPVLDLRTLYGLEAAAAACTSLKQLLAARRQDHEEWLTALQTSVETGTPFTKARDPHGCAFGKWYDHFHTDHYVLQSQLRKFEVPHAAIHALADRALGMASRGDAQGALLEIERTRLTTLSRLTQLFEATEAVVDEAYAEIALVIQTTRGAVALAVDNVEALETFQAEAVHGATVLGGRELPGITGVAQRGDQPAALLIDADAVGAFAR
jgi:chemotaxis signal transduction protein